MKRLWLVFAQSVTVLLAAYFVVATLKPQWLELIQRYPTRFMLGSDAFYDRDGISRGSSEEGLSNLRILLDSLPEPVRSAVASGNALRLYRLTP